MNGESYINGRIRVRRMTWYKLKAMAALRGKTLARFLEEVLEEVTKNDKEKKQ